MSRARFIASIVGAAAILVAPAAAHARRFPASRVQLDLDPGLWVEAGVEGGKTDNLDFGGLLLDARASLLPFAALRASVSALAASPQSGERQTWLGRSWLGAELFHGWVYDELRLRLGASFEGGMPPAGVDGEPPWRTSLEEPARDGWAWRARAGVALQGTGGYVQLEVADAHALVDEPRPYLDARTPADTRLALLSGGFAVDDRRTLAFDALLTDDLSFRFSAGYWGVFGYASPLHPRTSIGVTVVAGSDLVMLNVSLLHQR